MSHTTDELREMIAILENQVAQLNESNRSLWEEFHFLCRVIHRILELEEPVFTLHINSGANMAAITAGQSASFFLSATASDNSTPVLSAQNLTADDTNVTIAPDTTDTNGNTFTVTVPASDTATTFNLSASASVTSNTSTTPQTITATLAVTISPATQPVSFTLSINEK